MQELAIRMAPAGSSELSEATFVMVPIDVVLKLAHLPSQQKLQLSLQLADEMRQAAFKICRSQSKHLLALSQSMAEETARLENILAPRDAQNRLFLEDEGRGEQALESYGKLFQRFLLQENSLSQGEQPLSESEMVELRYFEDLLPVLFLARQRCKEHRKVDKLLEEVKRRKGELEKQQQASQGFFSRMLGRKPAPEPSKPAGELMSKEERDAFWQEVAKEENAEPVELPQRFDIRLALSGTQVLLMDDRYEDDRRRELLNLHLDGAETTVDVAMQEDHNGNSTAVFKVQSRMLQFSAKHNFEAFAQSLVEKGGAKSAHAACIVIENRLESSRSVLYISLDVVPIELHAVPGLVAPLQDFVAAPAKKQSDSQPAAPTFESDLRKTELMEFSKELVAAHAGQAKDVASKVYERLPDAMNLEIRIASPVLQVPMKRIGRAKISLGRLSVATPMPCAYSSIAMALNMTDAMVTTWSDRGEEFAMLQPIPIDLSLKCKTDEVGSSVSVQLHLDKMTLNVAPQSCRILMCVPTALSAMVATPDSEPEPLPAKATPQAAVQPPPTASVRARSLLASVKEVAGADAVAEEALAKMAATTEAIAEKSFKFSLRVGLDSLQLTLSDAITPVLRLRLSAPAPGLQFDMSRPPGRPTEMAGNHDDLSVALDFMNPRHGHFEPILEPFRLSAEFTNGQTSKKSDGGMHMVLSGLRPMLLNVTPSAVKTTAWFMPVLLSSMRPAVEEPAKDSEPSQPTLDRQNTSFQSVDESGTDCRYKVINLCDGTFEVDFQSPYQSSLQAEVEPTGDSWMSLDQWILPHYAESLTVRKKGDSGTSLPLLLGSGNRAVKVPGSGDIVAELLAPHPSCRVLLLSSSMRFHNKTNLPLLINFEGVSGVHDVACDAKLLGLNPDSCSAGTAFASPTPSGHAPPDTAEGLLVKPNGFCSVPVPRGGQAGGHGMYKVKIQSLSTVANLEETTTLGGVVEVKSNFSLNFDWGTSKTAGPALATVRTLSVMPTVTLTNALPAGELEVLVAGTDAGLQQASPVKIAPQQRVNVYARQQDFSERIFLQARLSAAVPWSTSVSFTKDALVNDSLDSDAWRSLPLCSAKGGAAATVSVGPVSRRELRLECANWFIDRSGLRSPSQLQLKFNGAPLPSYGGITLLPATCLDKECELSLQHDGREVAKRGLRMPVGYSTVSWAPRSPLPCGPLALTVQADSVSSSDMLGAQCQVFTLRPRLVLTNESDTALEVMQGSGTGRVFQLPARKSEVLHWNVKDDEDMPQTGLHFRPASRRGLAWSSNIECSETRAGSTALLIQAEDPSASSEVWSADVAPLRGALAVTFRQGSTFVAKNAAPEASLYMMISTSRAKKGVRVNNKSDNNSEGHRFCLAPGDEDCLGWPEARQSSVEIVLTDSAGRSVTVPVDDIHHKQQIPVRDMKAVVHVHREGQTKLLVLEDPPLVEATTTNASGTAPTTMELKISRIGLSLVQERPARELFYAQLDLIRLKLVSDGAIQDIRLQVWDGQVNCQSANRVDGSISEEQKRAQENDALGLLKERKAVMMAPCAGGDGALLSLMCKLSTTGNEVIVRTADVRLDTLDIALDDEVLQQLSSFSAACTAGDATGSGLPLEQIQKTASLPITQDYTPPPLPLVLQVDAMQMSTVDMNVWALLNMKYLRAINLSPHFLAAIQLISMSGTLTVDGARLTLPDRDLPSHRGSCADFFRGLASEYSMQLITATANVLGSSSVLNLPKVPLKLGGAGVSFIGDTIGLATESGTQLLDQLSFDKQYQEQQRKIRANKKIDNTGDGLAEAGKSLAKGLEGVFDVVRKPVEGAQSGGFGGFFSGVGQGLMGTLTKPIAAVGQAVGDVTTGLSAHVSQISGVNTQENMRVRGRWRSRRPRLMYSTEGIIHRWSPTDAEVLSGLGSAMTRGVQSVLTLRNISDPRLVVQIVLLLYPDRLILVQVIANKSKQGDARRSSVRQDVSLGSIASHALKPVNLVASFTKEAQSKAAYTLLGIEGDMDEAGDEPGDLEVQKSARVLPFNDIRQVQTDGPEVNAIRLETVGGLLPLEMDKDSVGGLPVRTALAEGLRQAAERAKGGEVAIVDWTSLRYAVDAEAFRGMGSSAARSFLDASPTRGARIGSDGGMLTLEVLECERRFTPFLPTDGEATWKWTDSQCRKHPSLIRGLRKEDAVTATEPPVDTGLLRPSTGWKVDFNENTDRDGWQYAVAFNSSTWGSSPTMGVVDQVRRRRWRCTFA
eukprot:TRINITY_DN65251_c0_g1_i1.p1 TRINITY_DN65251_c0_g1~~TRINITY_DN65251_c0_g1_i1.p1  ORF type:complete len:2243 (-),score=501.39 TRINITY_DN65251_c0_g1_i1:51-6779(-)